MDFTGTIIGAIALVLILVFKWIASKFKAGQAVIDAQEALFLAVNEVQAIYVDQIKKASEDGTLTDEEKAEAKKLAIERAKKIVSKEGLLVLKEWSAEKLGALIETFVNKIKK